MLGIRSASFTPPGKNNARNMQAHYAHILPAEIRLKIKSPIYLHQSIINQTN